MALISGTVVFSYDVGAKMSAAVYCYIFEVDNEHMYNYPNVLLAKIFALFVMMILTIIIPNNKEVRILAARLRNEHSKKLMEQQKKMKYIGM